MDEQMRRLERQAALGDREAAKKLQRLRFRLEGHTSECDLIKYWDSYQDWLDAYLQKDREYQLQWPNFCEVCYGWGGKGSFYDPSPAGVSLASGGFWEFDPCEECVAQGVCPRCAARIANFGPDIEQYECQTCGWVEQKTEGLPLNLPEPPRCSCWIESLEN